MRQEVRLVPGDNQVGAENNNRDKCSLYAFLMADEGNAVSWQDRYLAIT